MVIRTADQLKQIKARVTREHALQEGGHRVKITVHLGTCGIAAGGDEVYKVLQEKLASSKRQDIRVVISGCAGMCSSEPNVTVARLGEDGVLYRDVDGEKMRRIFDEHVLKGEIQTDCAMARIVQP